LTDFELCVARSLARNSLERLESVVEELEAMAVEEPAPYEARCRVAQVLHDLTTVRKYLARHIPRREVAAE